VVSGAGFVGLRDRRVCCVGLADIRVVVQQPAVASTQVGRRDILVPTGCGYYIAAGMPLLPAGQQYL